MIDRVRILPVRGFTLTELLVALVAGLIVVGSVLVFSVSAARSNAQVVGGARLLQQMRHALTVVTGEIRRSGYYADAAVPATAPNAPSDMPLVRSPSCIVVRYDRSGAPRGEYRGYRFASRSGVGVIQSSISAAREPDCLAGVGDPAWRDMTDPATVDVLDLSFTPAADAGGCTSLKNFAVIVQDVDVHLKARLAGNAEIVRTLDEAVLARNAIMASGSCT